MMVFKQKKLADGWKLGLNKTKKYLTVPSAKRGDDLLVTFDGQSQIIKKEETAIKVIKVKDVFKGGERALEIFEWKPDRTEQYKMI